MKLVEIKRRAEAVSVEDETFENLDLRSMRAFGSKWLFCTFRNCKFDLTDWRGSKFDNCKFIGCSVRLVNFSASFFEECSFIDCDLEQTSFMGSQFRNAGFFDCRLAYGDVMFQDCTVKEHLGFDGCNLHGSNLDFRDVEPKTLVFNRCNLWGAKVSFGCAFWNGSIDAKMSRQFLALVARASQDSLIAELAGDQYPVVCRAMDGRKDCRDTTTSQATTSTPILSFPDQTAMTASAASPQKTGT